MAVKGLIPLVAILIAATAMAQVKPFKLTIPPPVTATNNLGLIEVITGITVAAIVVGTTAWVVVNVRHAIDNIASNRDFILTNADRIVTKSQWIHSPPMTVNSCMPNRDCSWITTVEFSTNLTDWTVFAEVSTPIENCSMTVTSTIPSIATLMAFRAVDRRK